MVRCTWSAIEENSSRLAYKALKESGSNEIERYIEAFDAEMNAKEALIQDAEKEISRLQAEVRKLESNATSNKGIALQVGKEQNFFTGEILQIVLDAIDDAKQHVPDDSRRAHVLTAIARETPSTQAAKNQREQLKEVLRTYRSMDAKTKRTLESMGFSISEDGKHYKLVFYDDDRYTFTLAKSGSDHRGGLNAASDIAKRLF
jgi:NADH dehydrogenase/NADH:ubiquinone oxidoreductase subunit G